MTALSGKSADVLRTCLGIDTSLIAWMNAIRASTRKHCVNAVYRNTCEAI